MTDPIGGHVWMTVNRVPDPAPIPSPFVNPSQSDKCIRIHRRLRCLDDVNVGAQLRPSSRSEHVRGRRSAIAHLLETRALDDARVARALRADGAEGERARPASRHARAARDGDREGVAAEALADVFADLDERALIAKALQKKMRGTAAHRRSRRERTAVSVPDAAGVQPGGDRGSTRQVGRGGGRVVIS